MPWVTNVNSPSVGCKTQDTIIVSAGFSDFKAVTQPGRTRAQSLRRKSGLPCETDRWEQSPPVSTRGPTSQGQTSTSQSRGCKSQRDESASAASKKRSKSKRKHLNGESFQRNTHSMYCTRNILPAQPSRVTGQYFSPSVRRTGGLCRLRRVSSMTSGDAHSYESIERISWDGSFGATL